MSFIYYVLAFMLSYTGPVYAGLEVEKEYEIIEEDVYAQNEVEVGELPTGKIKVFTDQTHSTSIVVDKQDCSIMRKKDDTIALGWKFGGLMWGFGPEIKIGHTSGVAWKGDVQRMVAEYQELCTQFNTGRLSQQEYQVEKQSIVKRGYNYARELEQRFKQKKDDMFKEMDQGKYIHLQNTRFYEGCCYHPHKPEKYLVSKKRKLANGYGWLERATHEREIATKKWKNAQCRHSGYCNGKFVQKRYYKQHHNHRHHNNKDWNWDVYGNSNGNWDLRVEKEW